MQQVSVGREIYPLKGFLDGNVDRKKQEIVRGTKKEGWVEEEATSVVTSVAAASILEWGKREGVGVEKVGGRESCQLVRLEPDQRNFAEA